MKKKINNNTLYHKIMDDKIFKIALIYILLIILSIAFSNNVLQFTYFTFINQIFLSIPYSSLITIILSLFITIIVFNSFLRNSLLEQRFYSKKKLFHLILSNYLKILLTFLIFIFLISIITANLFSNFNMNFIVNGKINMQIIYILLNLYITAVNITIWFLIINILFNYIGEKISTVSIVFLALYQYVDPNFKLIFSYINSINNLWFLLVTPIILFVFYKLNLILYLKRNWRIK